MTPEPVTVPGCRYAEWGRHEPGCEHTAGAVDEADVAAPGAAMQPTDAQRAEWLGRLAAAVTTGRDAVIDAIFAAGVEAARSGLTVRALPARDPYTDWSGHDDDGLSVDVRQPAPRWATSGEWGVRHVLDGYVLATEAEADARRARDIAPSVFEVVHLGHGDWQATP